MINFVYAYNTLKHKISVLYPREDGRLPIMAKIDALDNEAVQIMCALLVVSDKRTAVGEKVSDHITRSPEEMIGLLGRRNGVSPIEEDEISDVLDKVESLSASELRERMIVTLHYLLAHFDPGLALRMMDRLEEISGNSLLFGELLPEDAMMYRKLYLLVLSRYSASASEDKLKYLLESDLLLLALDMNIRLPAVFGAFIWHFKIIAVRRELSLGFAASLALNPYKLGRGAKDDGRSISDWIRLLKETGFTKANASEIGSFIEKLDGWDANNEIDRLMIKQVLMFYYQLVAGYFIIEYGAYERFMKIGAPAGSGQAGFDESLGNGEELDRLFAGVNLNNLAEKLKSYDFREQVFLASKRGTGRGALAVIKEKLRAIIGEEIEDFGVAEAVTDFTDFLREGRGLRGEDMLVFDESKGVFVWG